MSSTDRKRSKFESRTGSPVRSDPRGRDRRRVAAIAPVDAGNQVVARVDANEHGAPVDFHPPDPRRVFRMTRALRYGMVTTNRKRGTVAPIPFGGMKQPGPGREGARRASKPSPKPITPAVIGTERSMTC